FGARDSESAHPFALADTRNVDRKVMDVYGYIVKDGARILKKEQKLYYDLAAAPRGGTLVVRTDIFYRGDLITKVNDRELPVVHLEPHKSLFTYVQVPLPADLGDGPLHVHQETTATDVAVFNAWLLEPR